MNQLIGHSLASRLFVIAFACSLSATGAVAQGVLDEDGKLVRFDRDIAPILKARCLECHGPDEAKNDFRVDDVDSLMAYVEPEDVESSSLFIDYLASEDKDMLMPPSAHGGPLTAGELALIRVWIDEGAVWPDGYELAAESTEAEAASGAGASTALLKAEGDVIDVDTSNTLFSRIWAFQGYLHPATVHFPIALLCFGALFVVLGWRWPDVGTQVPLACLWVGAPAAVIASTMGWSFATEQGYGSWDRFDPSTEVFWHRWSGVVITVVAVVSAIIAAIALWRDSKWLSGLWKTGLIVAALLVGLVGHQGGELTYGKAFYQRAFDRLWPPLQEFTAESDRPDAIRVVRSDEYQSDSPALDDAD